MLKRVSTLIDGVGTFGDARLRHTTAAEPAQAPSTPPMSPRDELDLLEKEARERGMEDDELAKTQQIGTCPAQVGTRIEHLHNWLAAH